MMQLFSRVLPGVAAALYERAMLSPRRTGVVRRSDHRIGNGITTRLAWGDGFIAARSWGTGPTVLLLHGWSGDSSDMEDFVAPLVTRGFRAVAFDAPAHGDSDGRRTNLVQCAGAALQVGGAFGPVWGAITHSFGGPTVALAMRNGLAVRRLALLGAPGSVLEMSALRARRAGVPEHVIELAHRRITKRLAIDWENSTTALLLAEADIPVLVVHDRDDRTVPWNDGAHIAASVPNSRLVTTTGLGHDGTLWDRGVIQAVADFIAPGAGASSQ